MPRLAPSALAALVVASLMMTMMPLTCQAVPDTSTAYLAIPVAEDGAPMSMAVSDDGNIIVAGYRYNGNLTVYSVLERGKLWTAQLSPGNGFQVMVSGDGSRVFAIDGSNTMYMFSVGGGSTPVWSYAIPVEAINIETNTNGSITMVGAYASAFLFNASGYVNNYTAVGESYYMDLAMTSDGSRAVAGCNKYLYVFNSALELVDRIWCGDRIGRFYSDPGVAISADGGTVAFSYWSPSSVAEMGINLNRPNGYDYFYPTFGGGYPTFRLSDDGSTVFLSDSGGLYLIDTVSMDVIWNRSMDRTPSALCVSPDGSMMVGSYEEDGLLRIYGRESSLPVSEVSIDHPYRMEFSRDGSTLVVVGDSVSVFRPAAPPVDPHDYSQQLADLKSQVGSLELIVMVLAAISVVTVAVLAVFVLRSRKP